MWAPWKTEDFKAAWLILEDLGDTFPRRSNTLDALRRSADKYRFWTPAVLDQALEFGFSGEAALAANWVC